MNTNKAIKLITALDELKTKKNENYATVVILAVVPL